MKGHEQFLAEYMSGSDKQFIIPVYQRNYDWKIEHCKQLFDDLVFVQKKVEEKRISLEALYQGKILKAFNPNT